MLRTISDTRGNQTLDRTEQADQNIRLIGLLLCECFTVFSLVRAARRGESHNTLVCFMSVFLVLLPEIVERLFRCRIRTAVYLLVMGYALCSMMGDAYFLYERIPWWDKFLHLLGGVHFAMLDAYLPLLFDRDTEKSVGLRAMTALCFSISVAALWEFYEYGMDQVFGLDMQRDAVVTSISSHLLSGSQETVESITGIESVVVNGREIGGYIDVGLNDTMRDMMIESLGALVYMLHFLKSRGEDPALAPRYGEG